MQQYFVEEIKENQVIFSLEQGYHLKNVLRCRIGDEVRVVDKESQVYVVSLTQVEPTIIGKVLRTVDIREQRPYVRLLAGLLKKEKWELMIQKAVEFGVDEIVPLVSSRCVIRLRSTDIAKKLQRWNKVSLEACKQCHRTTIVEVKKPVALAAIADYDAVIKLVAYEQASVENHIFNHLVEQEQASVNLVIGPEGGFAISEINEMLALNYTVVSLGFRILRAESAAMYCLNTVDNWLKLKK